MSQSLPFPVPVAAPEEPEPKGEEPETPCLERLRLKWLRRRKRRR